MAMQKNLGASDRLIRLTLALLVVILYFTGKITGSTALVLGIAAAVLALTSIIAWCPLYRLVGMRTCRR